MEVLVGDDVCRVHTIAEELECHRRMEGERGLHQGLSWRYNWVLCAESHKTGISTLQNTGVVVLPEIDPLDLGHVALHVDQLLPAVHLVTDFVERLIHVVREEYAEIGKTAD